MTITSLTDNLPTLDAALQHPDIQACPPDQREEAARALLSRQRCAQVAGRHTWDVGDPAPALDVRGVLDREGDLWQPGPNIGCPVSWHRITCTTEAPVTLSWGDLLAQHGPVTEPPREWGQQREDLLAGLRQTSETVQGMLFNGSRLSSSITNEYTSDTQLLDRASLLAKHMEELAVMLHTAVSDATLLRVNVAG